MKRCYRCSSSFEAASSGVRVDRFNEEKNEVQTQNSVEIVFMTLGNLYFFVTSLREITVSLLNGLKSHWIC
jgi:hypothetical protein